MAGLFGSNPFSTPVGQRIEKATDSALPSEDWALIIEICDIINETDDGPKDAIKAIRKRLSNHKNYKSILYTLTVSEACVKNCGPRFHKLVASKEFLNDLTKILGQKGQPSNMPQVVNERVLSLIQSWSDAFRNAPELQQIKVCYDSLKAQGHEFPAQDLDTLSPIFTPNRSELAGPEPQINGTRVRTFAPPPMHSAPVRGLPPPQQPSGPINPTPEQMAKMRSELDIVEGNVRVLSEMLSELQPGQEEPNDYQLLVALNKTCREMQKRVVVLVDRIANEEVTGVLLKVNDDLNNIFIRYDRYERNRKAVTGEVSREDAVDDSDIKLEDKGPSALIDFGDLSSDQATRNEADDEFDMFAQSRGTTFAASREAGSTYDDNREGVPNEGSIAGVMSARGPYPNPPPAAVRDNTDGKEVKLEDDIEDVEKWLDGMDLDKMEADERAAREAAMKENAPKYTVQTSDNANSMSSSEFDRFLSERARVGSQRVSTSPTEPARQMTNVAGERKNEEMFGL